MSDVEKSGPIPRWVILIIMVAITAMLGAVIVDWVLGL